MKFDDWYFNFKYVLYVPEIIQTLKTVVRYSGISGLWMGLSSTLLRDVPFSAIYWLNYETIKRLYSSYNSQQTFTFNLAAGAIAGSVCILHKNIIVTILHILHKYAKL